MSRWMLLWTLALAGPALGADEAVLNPDRAGVGESTGTPGVGFATVEGGVSAIIGSEYTAVQTQALTLRLGVLDGVEARVVLPDLVVGNGQFSMGPLAVGFKVAGVAHERLSLSVVPELLIEPNEPGLGFRLSSNVAVDLDPVVLWGNASSSVLGGTDVFGGGGASIAVKNGGAYAHTGYSTAARSTLIGGGAWIRARPRLQFDLGCDAWITRGKAAWVPMIGASTAF